MSIAITRAEKIIEDIVKSYLEKGTVPTLLEIEEEFDSIVATQNINLPFFRKINFKVEPHEESSSSKYNKKNKTIKSDLDILYKTLYRTTKRSVELFDKWETKANRLENRIFDLEGKIGRLLALSQDTAGYFDTVGDNFADVDKIDLDLSSLIDINLQQNLISMSKGTGPQAVVTKVFLNDLAPNQVAFNLLQQNNVIAVANIGNNEPRYAFYDENLYWQTHAVLSSPTVPLIGDLTVIPNSPISISKIDIQLHSSESNSLTRITPLISQDGVNFQQLPSQITSIESTSKMEFIFPEVTVNRVKFIIEKRGHDFIGSDNTYVYEFGAKEISFYKEAFSSNPNNRSLLVSKPLFTQDSDQNFTLFNKATLEVCEGTNDDTSIDYYISFAKNNDGEPMWLTASGFVTAPGHIVDGVDRRIWTPISPLNKMDSIHPQVIDVGSFSKIQQQNVGISYDKDADEIHQSPAIGYKILTLGIDDTIVEEDAETLAEERRYQFLRPGQKILDLQVDRNSDINLNSLVIWRNVGEKGIEPNNTEKRVRGIQIGWEFNDPYYSTQILIQRQEGMSIDVGNNPILIDQTNYTGVIGPSVLSQGVHSVKIHKDYWRSIPTEIQTKAILEEIDLLHPYNQKLLIEGYEYGDEFPEEEQVYRGVDLFAGILMEKVSVFDMLNNVSSNDYRKFSTDLDLPNTSEVDSSPAPLSYVFLVNTKNEVSDFMNEKFMVEFNLSSELFSFVALRAKFETSNPQVTPVLDEYRIKLAV